MAGWIRLAPNMLQISPIILFRTAPDYAFRFTYYSQVFSDVATPTSSLTCIAVVLALPVDIWWLWSFTISIYSRLVLDIFFSRQLSIVKYSYAESIPPFLLLKCCSRLVPDLVLTGNESQAAKCCLLFPHYARCSCMPIIPQIMPAYCACP